MTKQETSMDIIAEFRGYSAGMPPSYHVTMSWADFRKMLDRLDAAAKRERDRRNFHRFATAEEAVTAWHEHEEKDLGPKFCEGCPFNLGYEDCARGGVCSIGWLYTEAKEGGASK